MGAGGCDGHVASSLKQAVNAIEDQLRGIGLICSPNKSKLLIIAPKSRPKPESDITLQTTNGRTITKVAKIRVLVFQIKGNRQNNDTATRLEGKVAAATQLIKRVTNRRSGVQGRHRRVGQRKHGQAL